MKKIIVVFVLSLIYFKNYADSPITSTDFYMAYDDFEIIDQAHSSGTLDNTMISFLLDEKASLELKVALINALSWSFDGKNNAELFKNALSKKYKRNFSDFKLTKLRIMNYYVLVTLP